ncbi:hypothetical protein [Sphingomonas sp. IW22]|uniref:hypothetical protein n=1 Tax=Sphingomonas sp. IW22 TaxID=3242489 RepID=UPI003522441D
MADIQQAIQAQLGAQIARVPLAMDMFTRSDGAVAGSTTDTGQTWRDAQGSTSAIIKDNRFASSGGNGIVTTDLPGHQIKGVTIMQVRSNVGPHDAWMYGWFAEAGTPAAVIMQRGSDRIRLGVQAGFALNFMTEARVGSVADELLTLRLDAKARTASVSVDGRLVIPPLAMPQLAWGSAVGLRVGPAASFDHFIALREFAL